MIILIQVLYVNMHLHYRVCKRKVLIFCKGKKLQKAKRVKVKNLLLSF